MPNDQKANKEFIDETTQLFNTYSTSREDWAKHAKEDKEFRLGRQWTKEQEQTLKAR